MSEIKELYQQVILDHNKNPHNYYEISDPTHQAEGYNPLCGDRYIIYIKVQDDIIKKASFQGSGCAISTSSASIMTELFEGKAIKEVKIIITNFQKMLVDNKKYNVDLEHQLGKAVIFEGVKEFPTRLKCATLAWHTAKSALNKNYVNTK